MFPNYSDNISNTNRNQQCQKYFEQTLFDSEIFHLDDVFPSCLYIDFKAFFQTF